MSNLFNGSGDPKCCLRLRWVPDSSNTIGGFLVVCASQEIFYGVTQLVTFYVMESHALYYLVIHEDKILNTKSCFASNSYITFF